MTSPIALSTFIRSIPDFPKPGILYRDITPLLMSAPAFGESIRLLTDRFRDSGVTVIAAAEARGFIFAAPLALALNASFVPIRKPGKLPFEKRSFHYELEYGTDTLEVHVDAFPAGSKVLLVDDLLATGGTMQACVELAKSCEAEVVGCAFVIELLGLGGREKLEPIPVHSLLSYNEG
ncbi:MAG: adenine phosphoribosyltransferase [Planctomycetaceae bacterium]